MRGRKKSQGGAAVLDDDTVRCDMCGTSVPFTDDGRCDLGHPVDLPAPPDSSAPPVEAPEAETGSSVPPAAAAAATPPPSAAVPEARTSSEAVEDDPFFHPYDEVLGEEATPAPAPAQAPEPAAAEPAAGLAPEELEDLLSWDDDTDDLSFDLASELGDTDET